MVLQDIGRLCSHGRRADLELDRRDILRGVKLQHDAIHAVEDVVCFGDGQDVLFPTAHRYAFKVVVIDPCKAGRNGDLPCTGDTDSKVGLFGVDAGCAGAQVGGHVLGAVNHAVQRICDNAHCFLLMIGVPISVLTEFSPFWELRATEVMRAAA